MSIQMPFEVMTTEGWKQGNVVKEGDTVLCFDPVRGLEHRQVRQALAYVSNFSFTKFNNGSFSISLCDGVPVGPFIHSSMKAQEHSSISRLCKPEITEEYNPDPSLVYEGSLPDLESLSIEAVGQGVHAVVEHKETPCILVKEMPFVPVGPSPKCEAVAISCYENRPTHMVIRIAAFEECYKTFTLII